MSQTGLSKRSNHKFQFDVTADEHAQIKSKADEKGMTINQYIRWVLATYAGIEFRERKFQDRPVRGSKGI